MNIRTHDKSVKSLTSTTKPKALNQKTSSFHINKTPSFFDFVLNTSMDLCNASAGSFFAWDENRKVLVLAAIKGPYAGHLKNHSVNLKEGIVGWVGNRGQSILVKNVHGDDRFFSIKRNGQYRTPSFISLTVVSQNKLVGVLNITEKETLEPFDEKDFRCVQAFAQNVATLYEKLHHSEKLEHENKELSHVVRQLEQTSRQSEAFASVGKFSTHLSHELSNPLDAIRRYLNLAGQQVMEDSLAREYVFKAKKGVQNAIRVVHDVMQLAKAAHLKEARCVDLHETIEESLRPFLQDPKFKEIKVEKHFHTKPCRVLDYGLLLVLHNLYWNAQHAMKGSGVLTLTTEYLGSEVALMIEDTGCGISESVQESLFDPFVSTKPSGEGTGMGLAITREIIQRSKGKIQSIKRKEKGACFMITLPCEK